MTIAVIFHALESNKSIWADVSGFANTMENMGGVDSFTIIDLTDNNQYKKYSSKHHDTHVTTNLTNALSFYPTYTKVFLKEGGESLKDFVHPKDNVVYVLGADIDGVIEDTTGADHVIGIPTENSWVWSVQALAIVLYDRMVKT